MAKPAKYPFVFPLHNRCSCANIKMRKGLPFFARRSVRYFGNRPSNTLLGGHFLSIPVLKQGDNGYK